MQHYRKCRPSIKRDEMEHIVALELQFFFGLRWEDEEILDGFGEINLLPIAFTDF